LINYLFSHTYGLDISNTLPECYKWINKAKLKILTHGFLQDAKTHWITKLTQCNTLHRRFFGYMYNLIIIDIDSPLVYVNRGHNVITVDWSALAKFTSYWDDAAYIPEIGEHLGTYIAAIFRQGFVKSEAIELVGFSLGAHVAGIAGFTYNKIVKEKIGQITGKQCIFMI